MSPLSGTRRILLTLSAIAVLLLSAGSGSAFSVNVESWSGPALPGVAAATAPASISYTCGQVLPGPVGGDITIELEPAEGAQGSFNADADTFEPATPVADCTPGDEVTHWFNLSYAATLTQLEGSSATLTVRAIHDAPEGLGDEDEATTSATVGPYLDVTFTATNTSFEVIGGDTVTIEIEMASESNTDVMGMPSLDLPDGWESPRITPPNLASPLENGDGVAMIVFDIEVPEEADGENTLTFSAWGHTTTEPMLESEPVEIPLTFQVTPLAEVEAESEESPAPAGFIVLLVAFAALVAARRRSR